MSDNLNQRYPNAEFQATYPYNYATVSRSGHEFHINDTPGSESLRIAHTKGTFAEISSDGRLTVNVVGKTYYYMCDGFSETVDGHKDVKIAGTLNVNVDGSISETTAGNRYYNLGGDHIVGVGKSQFKHIEGDDGDSVGGSRTTNIDGDLSENIKGAVTTTIGGNKTELVEGSLSEIIKNNIEIQADGTIRIKCKNFIIDADTITITSKSLTSTSSGETLIVGAPVSVNP